MANTHEQARASAERARDALKARDTEKARVAVDRQVDRFRETAAQVKRGNWSKTS